MVSSPLKHIVFVPGPPWGHLRPGIKTALRLVEKFQNLFISIFVYETEMNKAVKYLDAQPSAYTRRIRIVTEPGNGGSAVFHGDMREAIMTLEVAFSSWITKEVQQASIAQVDARPVNAPSLIIEDLFTGGVSLVSKEVHKLPVVGWWVMPAGSLVAILKVLVIGQEQSVSKDLPLGGTRSEHSLTKANRIDTKEPSDRMVSVPGIPPYYEWEFATQDVPDMQPFIAFLSARLANLVKHAETVFCCTTFEMEPIVATALSGTFGKPVKTFFVGPSVDLIPPHQPDPSSPVTQFLDRAYNDNGAHSVVYISFGTLFFPLPGSISHLMAALDEIPKAGLRFVFALSSASATLDRSWMDEHIKAGNAIFPEWTNQTAVLEHPAIHYFLSHGGWNSSTEAIVRGVPMIFWPMAADQPMNAVQIATVQDCGFELLQVRTGPAKSTAYQNGTEVEIVGTEDAVRAEMKRILRMSKGLRGKHQRMNVQMLGQVVVDSLGPGGSGDIALGNLGQAIGLV
ncbi:UDP-glucose flavonoid 3-O-glucosyltransferase 6 OS=Fragaria ananassa GN=GT6 PE=1 SV=1 [Rhizoctonia solani AG-1 IB]|uniref:UDP-glucose flavonoid 3-O-glucosyltransferase 6 n=1 Tax=Thanatephorus cucumeris (strain AG1-IB / isolate 7/3/14) TaxID=1108050 RepID=M5C7E0_THACB|nr:UDP-glucose flavonoid 3-O-glucosyltransferase 6 [Rhizoctonia solani AG-1 IB]CEL60502.1 UDP-glucose flavonoid 3-O-glucosyltransferase 6 OS=Fragaria ananassa GN=GT6 PE=1 SV=1 [Rhizoctonia solani AG-1 IB]